ncbi:hypothetical protein XENORESO_005954 [Xenotaenia resolanae]|uniref:Uncharacterized protein n=1 Tax=Xenotaenia resolanae TaxID=208358 RepID=A0ABV0WL04_9TELE
MQDVTKMLFHVFIKVRHTLFSVPTGPSEPAANMEVSDSAGMHPQSTPDTPCSVSSLTVWKGSRGHAWVWTQVHSFTAGFKTPRVLDHAVTHLVVLLAAPYLGFWHWTVRMHGST